MRASFPADTGQLNHYSMIWRTSLVTETRSIVAERDMGHGLESIWKALTSPDLMVRWLMENDFAPVVGNHFNFRSTPIYGWNGVTDCEVLELLPLRRLVYSWEASGDQAADGLKTVVTWTLEPISTGTRVRMEQSGFREQDEMGFKAMGAGWPRILGQLEAIAPMA